MNNRGFHKMFILLVAFVVLVLTYLFVTTEPRTKASLKALYNQTEGVQKADLQVSDAPISADTETTDDLVLTDETKALLEELQPHQYHPDPFIEARTVAVFYSMCNRELNNEQWLEQQWVEQQLAENNPTAINDFIKYCAEAKRRYPNLLSLSDSHNQLQQIPSNSDLAQLIKQGYANYDPNFPQMYRMSVAKKLQAVLNSQNAALLVEESMSTFMHFYSGEFLPVSTWLNSQDMDYNNTVIWYALNKMSCRYQQGISCEPFGAAALMMCLNSPSVCGLDLESIYQMEVMPGMQKDVEILITHLEQFAAMN